MNKYFRVLEPIEVYKSHDEGAAVLKNLSIDKLIHYNREKRRDGVNWMEIYLENKQLGYIKKDMSKIFFCEYSELNDDLALGFDYKVKNGESLSIGEVFVPIPISGIRSGQTNTNEVTREIEVKRIQDKEKNKFEFIKLDYNPDFIEVNRIKLKKKERFYLIKSTRASTDAFIEIDNLRGKKGYLLKTTSVSPTKDNWMGMVAIIVGVATILGIIGVCFESGLLVIGTILIIPGLIAGFITVILLKIVLSIIEGIYQQIRKRF